MFKLIIKLKNYFQLTGINAYAIASYVHTDKGLICLRSFENDEVTGCPWHSQHPLSHHPPFTEWDVVWRNGGLHLITQLVYTQNNHIKILFIEILFGQLSLASYWLIFISCFNPVLVICILSWGHSLLGKILTSLSLRQELYGVCHIALLFRILLSLSHLPEFCPIN